PKTRKAGGQVREGRHSKLLKARASRGSRFAMQVQSTELTIGKGGLLPPSALCLATAVEPGRDGGTPPVRHRSESSSIQLKRARRPGSSPVWQVFAPSSASAAENTQHAKQNADRCGASRGDPGRRGKGQPRRGI